MLCCLGYLPRQQTLPLRVGGLLLVTTSLMTGMPASGTFQPDEGAESQVLFLIFRPDRVQCPQAAGFSQTAGRSSPCLRTPSVVGRCHPLLASQAGLPAKLMMRGSPRCLGCLPRQPGLLPLVTFATFSSLSPSVLKVSSYPRKFFGFSKLRIEFP